jgi:sulfite exporter TauE/SafE/plastocyanin domain-containing protein/copper chaperone CopZ
MSCLNCQNRIENALKSLKGVEDAKVDYKTGKASVVCFDGSVDASTVEGAVRSLGYGIGKDGRPPKTPVWEIAAAALIIGGLYVVMNFFGLNGVAFPLAENGTAYGMLFVVGLVTSVHCVAMCGGINLSQCLSKIPQPGTAVLQKNPRSPGKKAALFPALMYNGGRVASYTFVGALAGSLGRVVTASAQIQAAIQLAAGFFMVIMGLNMLGMFPVLRRLIPRPPRFLAKKIDALKASGKSPLFIGLLNGFMPCGPLQAMQLYALSTGSPAAGAFSMFLFGMGTTPLMFAAGALASFLSSGAGGGAFTRRVTQIGAAIVTAMGLMMFTYGINLSGVNLDFTALARGGGSQSRVRYGAGETGGEAFYPVIEGGFQIVNSTLSGGRYPAITVQEGIPVRWTIDAPQGSINGCNNRMIIREYGIERSFSPGANIVEFTPKKAGRFTYSCWMGMVRGSITVLAEGESAAGSKAASGLEPAPAGVSISTKKVELASVKEGGRYQTAAITLKDDGIEPAVIVLQKDVPALWTVNNDSLDSGNSSLVFPVYHERLDIEPGENVIQFLPYDDFDFSTADNVFYGFVKVVEDLNNVDLDAVKEQAEETETLIYPDAWFEQDAPPGCCARQDGAGAAAN